MKNPRKIFGLIVIIPEHVKGDKIGGSISKEFDK